MMYWENNNDKATPEAQQQMTVTAGTGRRIADYACDCPECRRTRLLQWLMIIAWGLMIVFLIKKINA